MMQDKVIEVTSTLEQELINILTKTVGAVEEAGGFLAAEIPEVVHQLLMWKALESGLSCALAVLLAIISLFSLRKFYRFMSVIPEGECDSRWELLCGEAVIVGGVIALILFGIFCGVLSDLWSTDWLQILVAPKVYLIEYTSNLIK